MRSRIPLADDILSPVTAEVVLAEASGPDSDGGMPVVRLSEKYSTIESASKAARAYIKQLARPPGSALYRIIDDQGRDSGRG